MSEYINIYPDRKPEDTLSCVKRIQTNTVNRLRVICVEDVGIGQAGICSIVDNMLCEWEKSDRKNSKFLVDIIRILCSSRKIRLVSDLKSTFHLPAYYGKNDTEELTIKGFIHRLRERYEIGKATGEENMLTDNISIFYWISENINDINHKHKIWEHLRKNIQYEYLGEINTLHKWFKKGQPAKETPIYLYQAVLLYVYRNKLSTHVKHLKLLDLEYPNDNSARYIHLKKIDDFCNDIHVRYSGIRSVALFANEGALVENEATEFLDDRYRNLYIHLKTAIDKKRNLTDDELFNLYNTDVVNVEIKEPDSDDEIIYIKRGEDKLYKLETQYDFVVRAQPTTSSSKTDTYFANDLVSGKFVFVKGPLKSIDQAEIAIEFNNWKKANNLPYMPSMKIEMLVPDRWLEGIPLGYRNNIVDRKKPQPFIVCDSTIQRATIIKNIITYQEYKDLKKDKKPPNKWSGDLQIVNWFAVHSHIDVKKLRDNEMKDYILNLLFRWIFGISDLADRNFLRKDDRVYSIDEEYKDRTVSFQVELKKNKCSIILEWLKDNYESLIFTVLSSWKVPEKYSARFEEVCDENKVKLLFSM